MRLSVLSSGSSGNATYMETDSGGLLDQGDQIFIRENMVVSSPFSHALILRQYGQSGSTPPLPKYRKQPIGRIK